MVGGGRRGAGRLALLYWKNGFFVNIVWAPDFKVQQQHQYLGARRDDSVRYVCRKNWFSSRYL